jgi:hypothetical protein
MRKKQRHFIVHAVRAAISAEMEVCCSKQTHARTGLFLRTSKLPMETPTKPKKKRKEKKTTQNRERRVQDKYRTPTAEE